MLIMNNNYLKKRGITSPWRISPIPNRKFNQIIIVPSYGESKDLPKMLSSLEKNDQILLDNTLVIIVVNNPRDANDLLKNDNKKTIHLLCSVKYSFSLGIVDATTSDLSLPLQFAGVGMARKIGMDLALPFLKNKRSLLLCTDADTTLDSNYLKTILNYFNKYNVNAAVVGFQHSISKNKHLEHAIREYEKFLLSTAKKIKATGSPYGYVSMGSTMVCTAEAYMSIGGMPKNKATEDFYFLQELAKFCGVYTIPKILVYPSSRPISRVYLGTGFRMNQVKEGFDIKSLYYSKHAFLLLEEWIKIGTNAWGITIVEILEKIDRKNKELKQFLLKEGLKKIWTNLQSSSPSKKHFVHQFHRWFDGLKTIRLLKYFTKKNHI